MKKDKIKTAFTIYSIIVLICCIGIWTMLITCKF